jgi:predicted DNA-binding transcriptional regulator AlpA
MAYSDTQPMRLLNAHDLGDRYGKSVSSIYRMNCYTPERLPPSIKIGSSLRWRLEDVEAWEQAKVGQK